jgi:hypothetical protein
MAVSKVLQRKMFRDPSQDENVGIMQGFMDDVHEMLGVDDMFDEEPGEEDDGGVAKAMGRRPNSPEILMNNLRGDMRSVDARIEELAEMVGYNAAASTPPEVLALLQPVLKQQGIAALEAAAPAMPDMGMAPPGMPEMGMAPPPGAMGMAPPAMESGIGSLPQGNMGQPPMQMARGGPVQYFQTGEEVVAGAFTPVDTRTFSPEVMDMFRQRILGQLDADPTAAAALQPGYLTRRTQELSPEYKALLGVDPGASKGQMLFDVAQAALNYAGNVNPQGQSLRGSQAARLAGAFSGLPAAIGARASDAQKQNQAIRLAAMEGAQSEIDAARSASISREDTLDKLAIEAMKNSGIAATSANKSSPISRAYDNGTVLTVVSTPSGPMTKVFNPDGEEVFGPDRTSVLRNARVEQVDFAQDKASATAEGAALVARAQDAIDVGYDAAMALPVLNRALLLMDEVETGGWNSVAIKARQAFGVESADEGELASLLGKGVLSQLKDTFGAAFTASEGQRLEGIEARMGANPETNRRLMQNAITIMNRAIDRGISAADNPDTTAELNSLRAITLGETIPATPTDPVNFTEGDVVVNPTTGERLKYTNGAWEKI